MRREKAMVRLQHSLSSPGLTGRSSIPETAVIEPRGRGVLDSPLAAYAKASAALDLSPGEALA
jgi:hypothetical protein